MKWLESGYFGSAKIVVSMAYDAEARRLYHNTAVSCSAYLMFIT